MKLKYLITFIIGITIGIVGSFIFIKNDVPVSDGNKVIMSIYNHNITANQLFDEFKNTSALHTSLNLIDDLILNDMYTLTDKDEETIKNNIEDMYQLYKDTYGYNKQEFLESEGFDNEVEFTKYMKSNYIRDLYYQDYLKSKVSQTDIDKYYDEFVFGKKKVYMYSSGTKSELKKVLTYLKKKKSYKYIKKQLPNVVCEELGYVDFRNELDDIVLKTIKKTKKNKYSNIFEIDNYGYAIIYVTDQKKVEDKESLKDDIISKLVTNSDNDDSTKFYQAFIELRDKYNFKFYDSKLKSSYNTYKKTYK